jgi:hypothetical protein
MSDREKEAIQKMGTGRLVEELLRAADRGAAGPETGNKADEHREAEDAPERFDKASEGP